MVADDLAPCFMYWKKRRGIGFHRAMTHQNGGQLDLRTPSLIVSWPNTFWDDIFAQPERVDQLVLENSRHGLFGSADGEEWGVFAASLMLMFLLESIGMFRVPEKQCGNLLSAMVCVLAVVPYGIFVSTTMEVGSQWWFGYIIEIILSLDNMFVFYMLLSAFRPPGPCVHKALFCGVASAIVMRFFLIWCLSKVVQSFFWIKLFFGAVLIWSGVDALRNEIAGDVNLTEGRTVLALKSILGDRFSPTFDVDGYIFVQGEDGKWRATMLLPLILSIEAIDILFAVDSLIAKVTHINNQFISMSSSAFAIFSLRSLFFVLQDLVESFRHLKFGLSSILIIIGLELLSSKWLAIRPAALVTGILAAFGGTMITSCIEKSSHNQLDAHCSQAALGEDGELASSGRFADAHHMEVWQ